MLEYIQEMREILHNLQNRIQKAKQNIDAISQAMKVSTQQAQSRASSEAQERVLGKAGHAEMLTESAEGRRNLLFAALDHIMMSRWP